MHENFHGVELIRRGYQGTAQDAWWDWLETKGFTGPIADAEIKWFESQGYMTGSINERFFRMYRDAGLTGCLDDMAGKWKIPEGGIDPPDSPGIVDPLYDDIIFLWNGELGHDAVIGGTGTRMGEGLVEETTSDLFGTHSGNFVPTGMSDHNCIAFTHDITVSNTAPLTIDFWARSIKSVHTYSTGVHLHGERVNLDIELSQSRGFFVGCPVGHIETGKGTLPLDQWFHIALVIANGKMKGYINGKLAAEADTVESEILCKYLAIGSRYDVPRPFCGRIDEVRITAAERWTEDFTPPTGPVLVP